MKNIYFDYAGTTPIDEKVAEEMKRVLDKKDGLFGNPSSLNIFGQRASALLDNSRERVAKMIGANYREIIFTSGATEANNLIIRGIVKSYFRRNNQRLTTNDLRQGQDEEKRTYADGEKICGGGIPKVIVSSIEHPSILETVRDIEKDGSIRAVYLKVDKNGVVDIEELKKELDEKTILVSVMWVNNEVGTVEPIREISKIISEFKKKNNNGYPIFHSDAVQAFNYYDLNVIKSGVDAMTLSGHKIYGPKGVGALYLSSKFKVQSSKLGEGEKYSKIVPIMTGGGQENGMRSGTENILGILGLAKAMEIATEKTRDESVRINELRNYLFDKIKEKLDKIEINGSFEKSAPHILSLFVPYKENLHISLDMEGMSVSTGSACSQKMLKPSHVLLAMGYDEKRSKNTIRISLGRWTTKEEIDELVGKIVGK